MSLTRIQELTELIYNTWQQDPREGQHVFREICERVLCQQPEFQAHIFVDKKRIEEVARRMCRTDKLGGDRVGAYEIDTINFLASLPEFQSEPARVVGLKAQIRSLEEAVDALTKERNAPWVAPWRPISEMKAGMLCVWVDISGIEHVGGDIVCAREEEGVAFFEFQKYQPRESELVRYLTERLNSKNVFGVDEIISVVRQYEQETAKDA